MRKAPQMSVLDRLLVRLRGSPAQAPALPPLPARPFRAISIYRGSEACTMAHKFSEHRFLTKDAPQLPLPGCTMSKKCDCRYVKHGDRRGDTRRLVDLGLVPTLFGAKERRYSKGRRGRD